MILESIYVYKEVDVVKSRSIEHLLYLQSRNVSTYTMICVALFVDTIWCDVYDL